MNHLQSSSKVYFWVVTLIVLAGIVLVFGLEVRAGRISNLEDIARIKEDVSSMDARAAKLERLHELALIKDEMPPTNTRLTGPSRLEELARIKER